MQTRTERYFYDGEEDKVYTLAELSRMFVDFQEDGSIEKDESFTDWLRNATDKNGSLDEITNDSIEDYAKRFYGKYHADLPLLAFDWETEKLINGWGISGMADYIVVRDYYDMIHDIDGNPIAYAVFVMKKKRVKL